MTNSTFLQTASEEYFHIFQILFVIDSSVKECDDSDTGSAFHVKKLFKKKTENSNLKFLKNRQQWRLLKTLTHQINIDDVEEWQRIASGMND